MSRIYEALKQSDESKPTSIVQLIEDNRHPNRKVKADTLAALHGASGSLRGTPPVESIPAPVSPPPREYKLVPIRISAGVPVFPFDGSDPRVAEQYRILRTNILQHPIQPKVLAISSATPGDGKTITAINLAGIMAVKSDAKVLIIDADLRKCRVGTALGLDQTPGLTDVLCGHCTLQQAIICIEQLPNCHVLTAGRISPYPTELLDSPSFTSLIDTLRADFSVIVLDTTPTIAVADFTLVQRVCDGVLLVVRPDHTDRAAFLKALELEPRGKLLGTVVNDLQDWFFRKAHDDSGYYSAKTIRQARSFWSPWRC
jgi:capsular exopolysaccharide synthesis family protein